MRAGLQRYIEVEEVSDGAGEPARACWLEALDEEERLERALWFAREALVELTEEWRALGGSFPEPVPTFIAGPDPYLGPAPSSEELRRRLVRCLPEGLQVLLGPAGVIDGGRAALFEAMRRALALLASGRYPMVLVGGLDSAACPSVLRALVDENRLLGKLNGDGLLPGEGAAFLLLASPRQLSARQALGLVLGVTTAQDPHPFAGQEPNRGDGLTRVFRDLTASFRARADEIFSAQPSEGFWGRELNYAYLRNPTLMPEPMRTTLVGAELGDTGSAAGAIALVLALESFRPPIFPRPIGRSALVYASADEGLVGACVLTRRS